MIIPFSTGISIWENLRKKCTFWDFLTGDPEVQGSSLYNPTLFAILPPGLPNELQYLLYFPGLDHAYLSSLTSTTTETYNSNDN